MIAHVAFGCFLQRLIIPREVGAVAQGFVDHPPTCLRMAHVGVELGEVPAFFGFCLDRCQRALVIGVIGEVREFVRVGFHIEELIGIEGAHVELPLAVAEGNEWCVGPLSRVFHRNRRVAGSPLPQRDDAFAIGPRHHL